jgi:hypothetical protein
MLWGVKQTHTTPWDPHWNRSYHDPTSNTNWTDPLCPTLPSVLYSLYQTVQKILLTAGSKASSRKEIFFELQARSRQPLSPQVLGHVENLKQDWPRFSVACGEFQTFLILLMDLFTCIYATWRGVIQTNWHKLYKCVWFNKASWLYRINQ